MNIAATHECFPAVKEGVDHLIAYSQTTYDVVFNVLLPSDQHVVRVSTVLNSLPHQRKHDGRPSERSTINKEEIDSESMATLRTVVLEAA